MRETVAIASLAFFSIASSLRRLSENLSSFDRLSANESINSRAHVQLRFAMSSSPELTGLEAEHDQKVFRHVVASQEKFGRSITAAEAYALKSQRWHRHIGREHCCASFVHFR